MNAPTHILRVVFALSTLACAAFVVLLVCGRAEWTQEFWLQLVAASVVVCVASCSVGFRGGRLRLVAAPLSRVVRVFLRQLVFAYLISAAVATAVALVVIYAITRSAPNALALAVLAGLWLSLWLAPGIASFTSWQKLCAASGNDA